MNKSKTMMGAGAILLAALNAEAVQPRPILPPKTGTVIVYRKACAATLYDPISPLFGLSVGAIISAITGLPL